MGCVEQTQFCNAKGQCGDLASYWDALDSATLVITGSTPGVWNAAPDPLGENLSRFSWFANVLTMAIDLITLVEVLGSGSLITQQKLMQGVMGPLPDNQWQLDVTHWWGTILASRQAACVSPATGPSDASLLPYTEPPDDVYRKALCINQVSQHFLFPTLHHQKLLTPGARKFSAQTSPLSASLVYILLMSLGFSSSSSRAY